MTTRREFIVGAGAGLMAMGAADKGRTMSAKKKAPADLDDPGGPVVLSTWRHGVAANEAAWPVLAEGGRALDAVERGVMVTEADPEVTSVSNIAYLTALRVEETGDATSLPSPTEFTAYHDFGGQPSPGGRC